MGAVIVDYFRTVEAAELARSLATNKAFDNGALIIVSNGSRDEDLRRASEIVAGLPVEITSLPNPGYGTAVNFGAKRLHGRADHLLVLTHEVQIESETPAMLSDALLARPDVAQVGPLLIDADSGLVWSAGGARSAVRAMPRHRYSGRPPGAVRAEMLRSAWLDGAVFMVRLEDFLARGGMDERFFLYMEDVEFSSRLQRQGRAVLCLTGATASQSPSGALDHYLATRNFLWLLRLERDKPRMVAWVVETLLRLAFGRLKSGHAERHGQRLRGLRDGLRTIHGQRQVER